jgi:hypothetical protein
MSIDNLNRFNPTERSETQQISFHLKHHFGDEVNVGSHSSAQVLRLPFIKNDMDARFEKRPWETSKINRVTEKAKTSSHASLEVWVEKLALRSDADKLGDLIWQPRLLVLANKALFILRAANNSSNKDSEIDYKELEIVDSIPLHEVHTVTSIAEVRPKSRAAPISTTNSVYEDSDGHVNERNRLLGKIKSRVASISTTNSVYEDREDHINERNRLLGKYDHILSNQEHTFACLRITTTPQGFNDGRPYYFRFGSYFDSSNHEKHLIEELAVEIRNLSEKQRQSVAFQVRVQRGQAALQRVWQSTAFNLVVLALIISNFIFTVRGMESTNPDDDAFFERIDLIYTVLFALGASTSLFPTP